MDETNSIAIPGKVSQQLSNIPAWLVYGGPGPLVTASRAESIPVHHQFPGADIQEFLDHESHWPGIRAGMPVEMRVGSVRKDE